MRLFYKFCFLPIALALILAGCATQAPYYKLDTSLQKDVRTFDGVQYLPLERLCNVYGIDYKWDSYIKTASLKKGRNSIALRAGSDTVLINDSVKRLDGPVVLDKGAVLVPTSFAKTELGPFIGKVPVERVQEVETPKRFTIKTVVIDAGHGGKDVGATGRRLRLREKHMTLDLARRLKKLLERNGMRVIMTRDSDIFVPLSKRAEIANRNGADLFVSVHINASRSRSLKGFECYYLSETTDDNARALAAAQESSIRLGEDAKMERSKSLEKTLWDLVLTENRRESSDLAGYICESVEESIPIGNRGVRSARFYVLKHTRMPTVLVEGGYISNRYEEAKFKEEGFMERLASAVAQGILKYKSEFERTQGFTRG